MPKLCPNIRFPHQQDFFPIRSVTKSSTSRFSHENLVEKFQIFVQDFVPIRTALTGIFFGDVDFSKLFVVPLPFSLCKPGCKGGVCLVAGEKPDKEIPGIVRARGDTV